MKGIHIILLCVALASAGFLAGRWAGIAGVKREANAELAGIGGGKPGAGGSAGGVRPSKFAARAQRQPGGAVTGGRTVDLAVEIIDRWNDQDVTLSDGEEFALLLFDLARFGHLMSALPSAEAGEIPALFAASIPEDDDSFETDSLKSILGMLVAARDIELHGGQALDRTIERVKANPDMMEMEEMMPSMVYTLALRDPEAAENWFRDVVDRPDVDDYIDLDDVRAALEKGKVDR